MRTPTDNYIVYDHIDDAAVGLTKLTSLLNSGEVVSDSPVPYLAGITGAAPSAGEYVVSFFRTTAGDVVGNWDNVALELKIDNNGSGNLTGGHSANTLKCIAYYAIETL